MALLHFAKCHVHEVAAIEGGGVTMSLKDLEHDPPQFDGTWFVAIPEASREMLAICLVAMTSGLAVDAFVQSVSPNAVIERLGLLRVSG